MRHQNTVFHSLLQRVPWNVFSRLVAEHKADARVRRMTTKSQLIAMLFGQLAGAESLRQIVLGLGSHAARLYHLGGRPVCRSTLSDANALRPHQVFAELCSQLMQQARARLRRAGEAVYLIDSTALPLNARSADWAHFSAKACGAKLHVIYDPLADVPSCVEVTPANINDVEVGARTAITAGTTYVFDKGYCRFDWWKKINDCGAFFVTRAKVNMRLRASRRRPLRKRKGDGFKVLADDEVVLASKGNASLPIPLRRIKIRRDNGGVITLITNDLQRSAVEIAALYKSRWQIELLFRWIKQHLDIRKFLGRNDNAIRLQVLAAMIAYLLLRIAARVNCTTMLPLRLAELVSQFLFTRRSIATITKPPPINPSKRQQRTSPNQLELCYG